jgi:hypothetical protein
MSSWLVRGWLAILLIGGAAVLAQYVSVYGWALAIVGVAAFFAAPLVVDSLVLARLAAKADAVERAKAHALLEQIRNNTSVRLFAPHAWLRIQEGKLLLAVDDGRAAAKAFAEAERVSKHPGDKPELLSAQAHALVIANDRKEAREVLAKLAKLERLSDLDHLNFGIVLLSESGHNKEALAHLEQARESFGSHPRVLAGLVLALQRCDQPEQAAALLDAAELAVADAGDQLAQDLLKRGKKGLRTFLKAKQKRERKTEVERDEVAAASKDKAKGKDKPKGKKGRKQARRDARKNAKSGNRSADDSTPTPTDASETAETMGDPRAGLDAQPEREDVELEGVAGSDDVAADSQAAADEPDADTSDASPTGDDDADHVQASTSDESSPRDATHESPAAEQPRIAAAAPADSRPQDATHERPADQPRIAADSPADSRPQDATHERPADQPRIATDSPADSRPQDATHERTAAPISSRTDDDIDLASLARSALNSGAARTTTTDVASTSVLRPLEPSSSSGSMFRSALFDEENAKDETSASSKPSSLFSLPDFGSVPKFAPPPKPTRGSVLPAISVPAAKPASAAKPALTSKPASSISVPAPKPPIPGPLAPPSVSAPSVSAPSVSAPSVSAPKLTTPKLEPVALDDGWGDFADLAVDTTPPVAPSPAHHDDKDA